MTKGQRAMAVAIIYPESEDAHESGKKGGRGKVLTESTPLGFDKAYLSRARTVLKHAPSRAPGVRRGLSQRRLQDDARGQAGGWVPAELAEHLK